MRRLAPGALSLLIAGAASASAWPSFRGGPANAAWVDLGALPAPRQAWTLRPSEEARSYANRTGVYGSPAVAEIDGRAVMFVGCYDHNIYAVDIATGRERWRFSTGAPVCATPAVVGLGSGPVTYVGSTDRLLYALDARDGTKRWARELIPWRASVGDAAPASPAAFDYRGAPAVLVCAWVHDRSAARPVEDATALAYDAENGRPLWRLPLGTSAPAAPGVIRRGDQWLAVVGAADGRVCALDLTRGRILWRRVLRGQIVASPAFVAAARPLALLGTRYGTMHAFDLETGDEAWSFRTGQGIDSSAAVARVGGLWAAFFGSNDQCLYAVSAVTGDLLWRFQTRGDVYSSPAVVPARSGSLVAFASGDDRLYLLRADTGREAWSTSPGKYLWGYRVVGDSLWSSPVAVALSGATTLLLPFYDGAIHAYPVTDAPPDREPSDPGYGRQMVGRAALTMLGTLALCLWLWRRQGVGSTS